ncbi:hypothetical protein D9758_011815 [Tetrapyrgos nigripes]|uniref:Haloacid dehalogenase n=1 Tax=Tetrapyrgos nigripes TaxID=182062 RepID=A0A8H5CKF3_9AGAR|nr:hypothetical protein D9758_011815 [Tetrapyrgos nigripes]
MPSQKLTDFKVLVFDTYGTLADWETGIYNGIKPLLAKYPASSSWSRDEALKAFTAVEADLQVRQPDLLYADLLSKSHEVLEERLRAASGKEVEKTTLEGDPSTTASQSDVGTSKSASQPASFTSGEHAAFGKSVKDWPIFPDSPSALQILSKYYKLCVLSNVDRDSYGYTLVKLSEGDSGASCDPEIYQSPSLGPGEFWFPRHNQPQSKSPFTLIVTAQDVKSYKPAHHGFNVTLDLIQKHPDLLNDPEGEEVKAKDKVLWVAQSVFHDIIPAKELGLETVWINREGASMGGPKELGPSATWVFNTLGEMAEAVEKE